LTFTTGSVPVISYCFDVADLYGGNATSGFVNQSSNLPGVSGEHGIRWTLSNIAAFSPSANYSSLLYRQSISSPNTDEQKPGNQARIRASVYPSKGCSEKDPNDNSTQGLLPWYGLGCLSGVNGRCATTPYSIASFRITPGAPKEQEGKCWDFARYGQSGAVQSSGSVLAAFVSAGLAIVLAL
jgi:hypothetical protein